MEKKSQRIISGETKDAFYGKPKPSELLKKHFEETPQEELDKEWESIKPLNYIGPDVVEYAKFFKTPEESLGISSEEYNRIVDACIWESGKEESDNKTEDYLERIAIDRVDKLIGKEVMSCVTLSDAEECYIQGYKDGRKSPITKFMEEHPITEEGLNKTRYRLAYEDGYRQCLKNVCDYLHENLPAYYWGNITASPKNFINQLNEAMEDKL